MQGGGTGTGLKLLSALVVVAALVLGWGYWHAQTHATLGLHVIDYGLATKRRLYDTPHDVKLGLFDAGGAPLATASSVEPWGYILALDPDPRVGNCEGHKGSQADYSSCFAAYSAWVSSWAGQVRSAAVEVGDCRIGDLPVETYTSSGDWWLWWVPHPHIGGIPRRYYGFTIRIDSALCSPVDKPRAMTYKISTVTDFAGPAHFAVLARPGRDSEV